MLVELQRALIADPQHPQNGQLLSLFMQDGVFVYPPARAGEIDHRIDLQGAVTMAGGIDLHTHIGGGKVNLARLLMADYERGGPNTVWPTEVNGRRYACMGYTTCFEPAMLLSGARHTHLELADTPLLDSGAYVVMGNEAWLLESLAAEIGDTTLDALVGWSVTASGAHAVKTVNPGGINAFRFNQRRLDVDEAHMHYGVSPRTVIRRLCASIDRLALPHPLHVHASNLGVAGNVEAAIATLRAAEGRRIHLTHAQFNCYSSDGPFGISSGAEILARYVNSHLNVSLDVGQIIFGQTVTLSADTAAQYRNHRHAHPDRWVVSDVECQGGCGLVPIKYEDSRYVHSLQWTIGLELMLLIEDPWRVFLTTDHPNGGAFTSYPHLIRLLMDRSFRASMLETIHPQAAERSLLRELDREYTLDEIAIVTRAGPARILGLHDRGSLLPGSRADVAAYPRRGDWEQTFASASWVFKGGSPTVEDGRWVEVGDAGLTLKAAVAYDRALFERQLGQRIEQILRLPLASLEISEEEFTKMIRPSVVATG